MNPLGEWRQISQEAHRAGASDDQQCAVRDGQHGVRCARIAVGCHEVDELHDHE